MPEAKTDLERLGTATPEAARQGSALVDGQLKQAAAGLAECEPEAVWLRRELKRDPRGTYEYLHGDANRVPPGIRRARGECVNSNRRPGHRSAASTRGSPSGDDDPGGDTDGPGERPRHLAPPTKAADSFACIGPELRGEVGA